MGHKNATSIELNNVSFAYKNDNRDTVEVLDHISLSIKKSEFFGFIGPSGCGKTTILKLIADIIEATEIEYFSGSISILGDKPANARINREFGFLFQDSILFPWRDVIQNVMLPSQIMGTVNTAEYDRAEKLLEIVGLKQFMKTKISSLSGGMQQRVSLVRALMSSPKILLLDEPFVSLDQLVREELVQLLQNLWKKTKPTVVLVSHDLTDVITLCDRIALLDTCPTKVIDTFEVMMPRPRSFENQLNDEYTIALKRVRDGLLSMSSGNKL
jgi:NitT/TauT family transport system ATP-binding protein